MNDHQHKLPVTQLRITTKALEKVERFARIVADEFGSPYESIGFLLAEKEPKGPEILITDAVLAHQQTVSPGSAQISPSGVLATGREIERKQKRCVGWWHAHPSSTFHSGTDDHNLKTVLDDISVSNSWPLTDAQQARLSWDGDALMIHTATETVRVTGEALSALRQSDTSGSPLSDLRAAVHNRALTAGAAYSLVVSASGKAPPYAEMAAYVHCDLCGRREVAAQQVEIEVVDPDEPDEESLRAEVRRKVLNLPRRIDITALDHSVERNECGAVSIN